MERKPEKQSPRGDYEVFISYRRESGAAEARLIQLALERHGLRVFLDVTDLGRGYFDESLLAAIAAAPNFLVVLSPGGLERCSAPGDWLRREVAAAIASQRNIVPVLLPGFTFPADLPADIADLRRYEGVEYSHTLFEGTVGKALVLLGASTESRHGRRAPGGVRTGSALAKQHLLGLSLAALVAAAAAAGGYAWWRSYSHAAAFGTIEDLKGQFHDAVNALVLSGSGNPAGARPYIDRAEADVRKLLQQDPNNGHAIYYSGELKRLQDPALFTPKSCLLPAQLKSPSQLDAYESDFLQYLDLERKLPPSETGGGESSDLCYARVAGYCPQRTAWVNHLLANDFFGEAQLALDPQEKRQKLERALGYAQTAEKLYQDNGVPGFSQCTPTSELIRSAQEKLAALPR